MMNVLLKPDMERFVAEKVKAGADASEIVNQALEILKAQEEFTPAHEQYLRHELLKGLTQLDRGEVSDFEAEKIIAQERHRFARGKAAG